MEEQPQEQTEQQTEFSGQYNQSAQIIETLQISGEINISSEINLSNEEEIQHQAQIEPVINETEPQATTVTSPTRTEMITDLTEPIESEVELQLASQIGESNEVTAAVSEPTAVEAFQSPNVSSIEVNNAVGITQISEPIEDRTGEVQNEPEKEEAAEPVIEAENVDITNPTETEGPKSSDQKQEIENTEPEVTTLTATAIVVENAEVSEEPISLEQSIEEKKSSDNDLTSALVTSQERVADIVENVSEEAVEQSPADIEAPVEHVITENEPVEDQSGVTTTATETTPKPTCESGEKAESEEMNENQVKTEANGEEEDEEESEQANSDAVADVIAAMELSGTSTLITPKTSTGRKRPKNKVVKSEASSSNLNMMAAVSLSLDASSGGQKRRKKDPQAPKAPLNGYLVYFNKERTEMHQMNPHIGFGELTKIIANKWKELPGEEKHRYTVEAEMDKERYVKEMADYKKTDSYKHYLKGRFKMFKK
jgi:hypothetical protein